MVPAARLELALDFVLSKGPLHWATRAWCVTGDSNPDWMRSERNASAVGLVTHGAVWWLRSTRLLDTSEVLYRMS